MWWGPNYYLVFDSTNLQSTCNSSISSCRYTYAKQCVCPCCEALGSNSGVRQEMYSQKMPASQDSVSTSAEHWHHWTPQHHTHTFVEHLNINKASCQSLFAPLKLSFKVFKSACYNNPTPIPFSYFPALFGGTHGLVNIFLQLGYRSVVPPFRITRVV